MRRFIEKCSLVCLLAVMLLTLGCSKVSKTNIDKIQKGMTEAEVTAILGTGKPTTRDTTPPDMKEVTWESSSDSIMVQFKDGKVEGMRKSHEE
jgi:hypothetical protein